MSEMRFVQIGIAGIQGMPGGCLNFDLSDYVMYCDWRRIVFSVIAKCDRGLYFRVAAH